MNLQPYFEAQKKLDEHIIQEKGLEGQDLLDKKILALQVELGELAQEWRGFKFWSEDQEPNTLEIIECQFCDEGSIHNGKIETETCIECGGEFIIERKNPLLEEYVDCLHFILSIGLEHNFDEEYPFLVIEELEAPSITEQFTMLMRTDWEIYEEGCGGYYHEGLELFLKLGEMLGFSEQQIHDAYFDKNATNHKRQQNGY